MSGAENRSVMTASRSAPAAISGGALASVMPPMAQVAAPLGNVPLVRSTRILREKTGRPQRSGHLAWLAMDRQPRMRHSRHRSYSPFVQRNNRRSRRRRGCVPGREWRGRRQGCHLRGRGAAPSALARKASAMSSLTISSASWLRVRRRSACARATRSGGVLRLSRYCTMRHPPASAASTSANRRSPSGFSGVMA